MLINKKLSLIIVYYTDKLKFEGGYFECILMNMNALIAL